MRNQIVAALAAFLLCSTAASAQTTDELSKQIEALKNKEAAKDAEISALRSKIKSLEAQAQAPRTPVATRPPLSAITRGVPGSKAYALTPVSSWEGFYFGTGFSRNRSRIDQGTSTTVGSTTAPAPATVTDTHSLERVDFNSAGFISLGYMWQFNKFVLGLEGDYTFSQNVEVGRQYVGLAGGTCGVPFTGSFTCSGTQPHATFDTIGHLRALVGYEINPRVLGFLSAGIAIGKAEGSVHTGILTAQSPAMPMAISADSTSQNKLMLGGSVGGGFEVKLTNNFSTRFEYLHDWYSGPRTTGSTVTQVFTTLTTTQTVPSQKIKITNDAVRAALIYRFDPDGTPRSAIGELWAEMNSPAVRDPDTWGGFYVGGGLSQSNYSVSQNGGITFSIDDSTTPGVDVQGRSGWTRSAGLWSGHVLAGYRYQWGRFLIGFEGDWNFNSRASMGGNEKSPGQFGSAGAVQECYLQFQPSIVCLGLGPAQGPHFANKGHLRFTGGYVITPDLMGFLAAGWAWGDAGGAISAGAAGIVSVPPSAPLVGAATVTRVMPTERIQGVSFGGGFEMKATPQVSVRAEYYHDSYTWKHLPVGGAGFGGTIGTITTNSFAAAASKHDITNDTYRLSMIYRFWNPQSSGSPGFLSSIFRQ
jgi:opacity protein-like surface antigen